VEKNHQIKTETRQHQEPSSKPLYDQKFAPPHPNTPLIHDYPTVADDRTRCDECSTDQTLNREEVRRAYLRLMLNAHGKFRTPHQTV
jgi:hypothetical protein